MFGFLKLLPQFFGVMNDVQTKGWYTSKTIWFNLLLFAFLLLVQFGVEVPVAGEEMEAIALALSIVGNIVLRAVTTKPIVLRAKPAITDDSVVGKEQPDD